MRTAKRANNGIEFSFGTPQKIISRVVVVELVVLNRIDEAEGQRPFCVLCHLDQTSNRVAPRKKRSVAESLVCVNLRSEEHTSELQSQSNLVCRLLLEKKKKSKRFFASDR